MKYLGIIRDQLVDDLKEAQQENIPDYEKVAQAWNDCEQRVLRRYLKIVDEMILTEMEVKSDESWITEILEVKDEDSES